MRRVVVQEDLVEDTEDGVALRAREEVGPGVAALDDGVVIEVLLVLAEIAPVIKVSRIELGVVADDNGVVVHPQLAPREVL